MTNKPRQTRNFADGADVRPSSRQHLGDGLHPTHWKGCSGGVKPLGGDCMLAIPGRLQHAVSLPSPCPREHARSSNVGSGIILHIATLRARPGRLFHWQDQRGGWRWLQADPSRTAPGPRRARSRTCADRAHNCRHWYSSGPVTVLRRPAQPSNWREFFPRRF